VGTPGKSLENLDEESRVSKKGHETNGRKEKCRKSVGVATGIGV